MQINNIVTLNEVSKYKWWVSLHFHSYRMEQGIYRGPLELIHMEEINLFLKIF